MNNKVLISLYTEKIKQINLETVFDIITLYGNGKVDGIEINSFNLEDLKRCATLCRKNKLLFRCHFPLKKINEMETKKYLDCLEEISNELKYSVNVVFHSDTEHDEMQQKIEETAKYMKNILEYIKKYKLGVTVSLENLNFRHDIKRINMDKIDNILERNSNLYFTYDIGHDIFDNKKCTVLSKLQKERINNVHIHSVFKKEDHHMIEKESKDFEQIKQAMDNLKGMNYSGPIVLEYGMEYIVGQGIEEKIINLVKSVAKFKENFM